MQVLVHGSAEATEHLRQHCLKNVCNYVYAPRIGETVDITSDLSAYKVFSLLFMPCTIVCLIYDGKFCCKPYLRKPVAFISLCISKFQSSAYEDCVPAMST